MTDHEFGGDWTEIKLQALKGYLAAYRKIFTQNQNAQYYKTLYVDAFSGTGERKTASDKSADGLLFTSDDLPEVEMYKKGSARIALELESPFDEYVFVDKNRAHTDQLNAMLASDFPHLKDRCRVWTTDGPQAVRDLCLFKGEWKKHRAVVFLDPYGMNVEWQLLQQIAKTKAIDLWYLFPLGMGVNRLLKRDAPPSKDFSDKLTRMFGDASWQTEFYKESPQRGLFDNETALVKDVSFEKIGQYLIKRLETIFAKVAPTTKALYNSRNNPMYLLCFAAGNEKGAPTAIKIADHLLKQ